MRLKFSLGAVMINASDLSSGAWTSATLQLSVTDWEGVYVGTDIAVGDSVWLDTSGYEPGTMTQYEITALGARTASSATVTVTFLPTDHAAPDLSYAVGSRAVVSRPGSRDVSPVPSPGVQQIPDKFAFSLINANSELLGGEAAHASVSNITHTAGKVSGFVVNADLYAVAYGADGVLSITKNGLPHLSVTYADGYPTAIGPGHVGTTNPLAALMGDSLTDPSFGLSSFYAINANTGGKLKLVANVGISGNSTAAMLARVNNSYQAGSPGLGGLPRLGRVFVRAGTNDARNLEPISGLAATYTALLNACSMYADEVVILAVPPLSAAGQNAAAASYNAWLASFAASAPAVFRYVDDCVGLRNPDGSQIAGGFNVDGVHLSGSGVAQCGIDGAMAMSAALAAYPSPLSTDPADVYPAHPQWFPNPTILGTGGTKGGGFTGVVANSLSVEAYGAGVTGVCSIIPAVAGDANQTPWQRISLTAGNTASRAQLLAGPVGRAITATDPTVLDTVLAVRFAAVDRSKVAGVAVMAQAWDGEHLVPVTTYWLTDAAGTESREIVLRATHRRAGNSVPPGMTFYFYVMFRATFTGAAGSIDIRNVTMRG